MAFCNATAANSLSDFELNWTESETMTRINTLVMNCLYEYSTYLYHG